MKNVLLFIFAVAVGLGIVFFMQMQKPKPVLKSTPIAPSVTPTPFSVEKAPTNSLVGNLELSGDVAWQSRVATEPATITTPQIIQQGEDIKTASGTATITFKDAATITVSKDSEVSIVQTLPAAFVFLEPMGTVDYQRIGTIPLSVRAMHLLLDAEVGDMTVSVDKEEQTVVVSVKAGSVTAAYNDLDLNSQVLKMAQGKRLIFDDETREAIIR